MKITLRHGTACAGSSCAARAGVFPLPAGAVIAVADGTGEPDAGGHAAEIVLKYAEQLANQPELRANYQSYQQHLSSMDQVIKADEPSAQASIIVSAISEKGIAGYSVGDCRAWFLHAQGELELTQKQLSEPLVGTGQAAMLPFAVQAALGTILFCSNGLWRNVEHQQMFQIARGEDLGAAAKSLLALPRYPGGGLPDDVAMVLCRIEQGE